jgi:dihydroorotase
LSESEKINPATFLSKGKSTPFAGKRVFGVNHLTIANGHVVYSKKK